MVPPSSDQVSRVWPYSGYCAAAPVFAYVSLTLSGWLSHTIRLTVAVLKAVRTPGVFLPQVWPLPRSHLDVSVQAVPSIHLFDSVYGTGVLLRWVSPFRNLRIKDYLHLPAAYRSLSRLSSAPSAKAFALRPF